MANPAELLLNQLNEWRGNSGYPNMDDQRIAVSHLDAIDELLDRMGEMNLKPEIHRRYFDKWAELVLHTPHAWQTQGPHKHIDNSALENLEHLSNTLDIFMEKLQPGGLEAITEYVNDVSKLLDEDTSVQDPGLRRHLRQVIAHLNWCIANFNAVGEFNLQEAIERLAAAMLRFALKSNEKERWKDKMNTVDWPFVVSTMASITSTPATLAITAALGGGG